jgi:hypothetical protein
MTERLKTALALAAAAALATACGGGGGGIGGTGSAEPLGTLRVALTDAPACYSAVFVTIQKVRVHKNAGAADGDAGWEEIVLNPARRVNLRTLTNGVLEELGQASLPAGKYTQLRLVLAENDNTPPLENSVIPVGGTETPLDTPSAQQSGLKLNVDIDVAADKIADIVIDFDACKSVVARGNSGQFNLKPVISVTPILSDAGMRVIGYVDPSIAASTDVSVQSGGVPVKATLPDATGKFVLYPVPVGSYDLVVSATGHVTAVMTGVPVVSTAFTTINSASVPISPAGSATRVVTGTLTPATATVRAIQALSGGPTVQAAAGVVDGSGGFTFTLPIGAPVKTAYAVNPVSLGFIADSAAAGKYTLEAKSAGVVQLRPIDVSAVVPPVIFLFP